MTKEARGVLNLATGVGTSIGDVVRVALEVAGEPAREIISTGQARGTAIVADYSRTAQLCGWQPRVRLRDGLALLLRGSAVPH
jgi:nucleoside-diphosphate-sugar epimerase